MDLNLDSLAIVKTIKKGVFNSMKDHALLWKIKRLIELRDKV